MSIHTHITPTHITQLLESYAIGNLVAFSGIDAGITNSNYRIQTTQNKYILTLFEALTATQLPFFLDLMSFLATNNIPCPQPIADQRNHYIHHINNKPAVFIEYLPGDTPITPTIEQCIEIGKFLAMMHLATPLFGQKKISSRGAQWHKSTTAKIIAHLSTKEKILLEQEMYYQQQQNYSALPQGIIHADLFPDNALFLNNTLTGIIDFYYACDGYYLWDLAVTVNSWCLNADNHFNQKKIDALLNAYQTQRPLTPAELTHWNATRRSAALRFWLSRLHDYHYPSTAGTVHIKDPHEIEQHIMQLKDA
jgi:homoserine kinase type II